MLFRLQKCTPTDLNDLVQVSRETFVDAFEKDNDPEDFQNYIDFAFDKQKLQDELDNPDAAFYFGLIGDQVIGYIKLNQNDAQTDIRAHEAIELERIYVKKEFQGRKIGEQLLKEALEIASKACKTYIWLGVWEKNTNAIRFYERHGFSKFGTHPYFIGNDEQTDWLMHYDLSNFQQSS
ncbi:MAG: GNAT family N-acetyltransferase [Flavobacteriaceae bacterium]